MSGAPKWNDEQIADARKWVDALTVDGPTKNLMLGVCTALEAHRAACQTVMQWLGPSVPTTCCSGCESEMEAAVAAVRNVGVEYRRSKSQLRRLAVQRGEKIDL